MLLGRTLTKSRCALRRICISCTICLRTVSSYRSWMIFSVDSCQDGQEKRQQWFDFFRPRLHTQSRSPRQAADEEPQSGPHCFEAGARSQASICGSLTLPSVAVPHFAHSPAAPDPKGGCSRSRSSSTTSSRGVNTVIGSLAWKTIGALAAGARGYLGWAEPLVLPGKRRWLQGSGGRGSWQRLPGTGRAWGMGRG